MVPPWPAQSPDGRVDVGHRDQQAHRRAVERLRHGELVEVARVVVVDRDPVEPAQVVDGAAAQALGLLERVRLAHDVGAVLAARALRKVAVGK